MSTTVTLLNHPVGMAFSNALGGEEVEVLCNSAIATWHGEEFAKCAEFITDLFPSLFVPHGPVKQSQVDNFLAIIRQDKTATVYCNEVGKVAKVRLKQPHNDIKKGEPIYEAAISEVGELELQDKGGLPIEIPSDCGYIFLMSSGWRKVIIFDFRPFPPHEPFVRTENLSRKFAGYFGHLLFRSLTNVEKESWHNLNAWGWFPFVWMDDKDRITLISFAKEGRKPQSFLDEQCNKFSANLSERASRWKRREEFAEHMPFIESAIRTFNEGDYVSSLSTLISRIEGILRLLVFNESHNPGKITSAMMAANLVENRTEFSSLLPSAFKDYLVKFYFRDFQTGGDAPLSRHSASHGVSSAADYNRETASLAFMTLDQIAYYLVD